MSNQVFPSNLPSIVRMERSIDYATKVMTSHSGKEQRVRFQSVPRYRYTVRFDWLSQDDNAPAPNATEKEADLLQRFFDDHGGSWDSFLLNDPYSGSQVRVRFASDTLTLTRLGNRIWAISKVEMIQVL